MRAVVQRVSRASVQVGDRRVAQIGPGLCVLVGVSTHDGPRDARTMAEKLSGLRVLADAQGKMNLSLLESDGSMLVVSQFTLYADVHRGRRPGFAHAAPPGLAEPLLNEMVDHLRERGLDVVTGEFGAHMELDLVNDGPLTLVIETVDGRFV